MNNDITCQWSIVCEQTSVDSSSNLLSIFNVVEEITMSDLMVNGVRVILNELSEKRPIVVQKNIEYISFWRRSQMVDIKEKLEKKVRLELISPSGKSLMKNDLSVIMESGKQSLRMIVKIDNIAITTSGTYLFRLSSQNNKNEYSVNIFETPIDIKIV